MRTCRYPDPIGDGHQYSFDYGTHFILKTGDEEIDTLLDMDIQQEACREFNDSLPEGHYINGSFYSDSGCVNAAFLGNETFQKIKNELSVIVGKPKEKTNNLQETFLQKYGQTATEEIFAPAMKKFSGCSLEELDNCNETAFNSGRLIIENRENSIALKREKKWDDVIAFAHHRDGSSTIKKYYPLEGGVQLWVDTISKRLIDAGVEILTQSEIESIEKEDSRIKSIKLKGAATIPCDYLVWTLPPVFLAKILNVEVQSKPPNIRSVSVINIITDKKPVSGPFWVTVYDPAIMSFRVTLYNNFEQSENADKFKISVEILHDKNLEWDEEDNKKIFQELKTMNILDPDSELLWSKREFIPAGFPVLNPGDVEIYDNQARKVNQSVGNAYIVSRHNQGLHGQMAIMKNIYAALGKESKTKGRIK